MKTILKTLLIFTVTLLCINTVKAQKPKVDKKAAKIAAYQKMIDTADWSIVMEKAFPKAAGASTANPVNMAGNSNISISHGVITCDLPYYGGDAINNAGRRVKFTSNNFVYESQHKSGSTSPYQYDLFIAPKPGSTDFGNVAQIVLSIISEDVVQVSVTFTTTELDPVGYQGYIIPFKKFD